jgi:hypothetical protein
MEFAFSSLYSQCTSTSFRIDQVCSRNNLAFALLVEFEITLEKILASLHYFYANFISKEHFSNRNNLYSLSMVWKCIKLLKSSGNLDTYHMERTGIRKKYWFNADGICIFQSVQSVHINIVHTILCLFRKW